MTNAEFRAAQDRLGLNNKSLAATLRCDPGSITKWRGETKIPPYIVALLELLLASQDREVAIPLTIPDLIALARKAERAGRPVDEYLLSLIRADISKTAPRPKPRSLPPATGDADDQLRKRG